MWSDARPHIVSEGTEGLCVAYAVGPRRALPCPATNLRSGYVQNAIHHAESFVLAEAPSATTRRPFRVETVFVSSTPASRNDLWSSWLDGYHDVLPRSCLRMPMCRCFAYGTRPSPPVCLFATLPLQQAFLPLAACHPCPPERHSAVVAHPLRVWPPVASRSSNGCRCHIARSSSTSLRASQSYARWLRLLLFHALAFLFLFASH